MSDNILPMRDEDDVQRAPYADAMSSWTSAEWPSVLPLPAGSKGPPPPGFTGVEGADPTPEQMQWWAGRQPADNAALRLPDGVVGLDLDDYGGKGGGATWEAHKRRYGSPLATWTVTNREDGVSGTRLYRTGFTGPFRQELDGGGVDVIHRRHRYVTLPPSLHPEGRWYRLLGPEGETTSVAPSPAVLPVLPVEWDEALRSPRAGRGRHAARKISKAAAPAEPGVEDPLAGLAVELMRTGRAKGIRDEAGLSLDGLAQVLGISRKRAGHLEAGKLRALRPGLLARYGRFLQEHSRPVR